MERCRTEPPEIQGPAQGNLDMTAGSQGTGLSRCHARRYRASQRHVRTEQEGTEKTRVREANSTRAVRAHAQSPRPASGIYVKLAGRLQRGTMLLTNSLSLRPTSRARRVFRSLRSFVLGSASEIARLRSLAPILHLSITSTFA